MLPRRESEYKFNGLLKVNPSLLVQLFHSWTHSGLLVSLRHGRPSLYSTFTFFCSHYTSPMPICTNRENIASLAQQVLGPRTLLVRYFFAMELYISGSSLYSFMIKGWLWLSSSAPAEWCYWQMEWTFWRIMHSVYVFPFVLSRIQLPSFDSAVYEKCPCPVCNLSIIDDDVEAYH